MGERWRQLAGRWIGLNVSTADPLVKSSNQDCDIDSSSQDDELLALIDSGRDLFEEHSNGTFSLDLSNPDTAQRLGEEISKFKNFVTK